MDLKKLLPENGPPIKEVSKYILSGESLLVTKKTMQGYINSSKEISKL